MYIWADKVVYEHKKAYPKFPFGFLISNSGLTKTAKKTVVINYNCLFVSCISKSFLIEIVWNGFKVIGNGFVRTVKLHTEPFHLWKSLIGCSFFMILYRLQKKWGILKQFLQQNEYSFCFLGSSIWCKWLKWENIHSFDFSVFSNRRDNGGNGNEFLLIHNKVRDGIWFLVLYI